MEIQVVNQSGQATGQSVTVADATFAAEYKESLVHQIVVAYQAGARQGTKAQKTRAEVSGGGVKPWKQKGTGRARAGTIRSPLWRKGGVIFAAKPRDHSQKVNRKMYRGAMRSLLSELYREGALVVLDRLVLEAPKTRLLVKQLQDMSVKSALIVLDQEDSVLELAARNLYHVGILRASEINPVSLFAYEKILITVPALKQLEERLA